jgi:phosphopantetheinyl transferase
LLRTLGQVFVAGGDLDLRPLFDERVDGADRLSPEGRRPVAAPRRKPTRDGALRTGAARAWSQTMRAWMDQQARTHGLIQQALRAPPMEARLGAANPGASPTTPPPGHATMSRLFEDAIRQGTQWRATVKVSIADRFLKDHTLGRKPSAAQPDLAALPVIPFAMSMEIAAQAALASCGAPLRVVALSDLRGHRWLVVDREVLKLVVVAESIPSRGDGRSVAVKIFEAPRNGDELLGFETVVELAPDYPQPPPAIALGPLQPSPRLRSVARYAEDWLFHGPCYSILDRLIGLSDEGVAVEVRQPRSDWIMRAGATPDLATPANMLDVAGQLFAYWLAETDPRPFSSFPVRIDRIELFAAPRRPDTRMVARARLGLRRDILEGDLDVCDPDERVAIRFNGAAMRRFDVPDPVLMLLYCVARRPALIRPVDVGPHRVWLLDSLPAEFLRQGGSIWARALAHAALGSEERARWYDIPETSPRRIDWLLGRLAAKEAARLHLVESEGWEPALPDIGVVNDPLGRPRLAHVAGRRPLALPEISISHRDSLAAVLAVERGHRPGVDIERLQAERRSNGLDRGFDEAELKLGEKVFGGDGKIVLWSAKEAVSKVIGTGLVGEPRRLRAVAATPGHVAIEAGGRLFDAHVRIMRPFVITAAIAGDGTAHTAGTRLLQAAVASG